MNHLYLYCLLILLLSIPNKGKAVVAFHQASDTVAASLTPMEVMDAGKNALHFEKTKNRKRSRHFLSKSKTLPQTDVFALAGLLAPLVGFVGLSTFYIAAAIIFGWVMGFLGIVFSIIALKRIRRKPTLRKGKKLCILGLFLGSILLIVASLGALGYFFL